MLTSLDIIKKISFLYLLFCLIFFIIKYDDFPAWYDSLLQIFFVIFNYLLARYIFTQKSNFHLYIGIFIFHLICAILSQCVNYFVYDDFYGYNPIDAQLYRSIAFDYNSVSMFDMLKGLVWRGYLFDDFGYPIVTWFIGSISKEYFTSLLVMVNSIVVTIGSYYLYKLSSLFVGSYYTKLIVFLWGTMPFAIYVTANGLKENVFLMFVIIALWRLYMCTIKYSLFNLILFILFCISIFMFRLVLGYAILAAYFTYIIFNNKLIKKYYKIVLTISVVFLLLISKTVSSTIIEQRGHDIESMSESAANKITEAGGNTAVLTNYLSALFGPFPNFVSESYEKRTYITRYSFSAFVKSFISFFLIVSFGFIIKKRKTDLFPILAFGCINIIMLIFTFRTLDVRFQWPHFPVVLILSAYAYENIEKKSRIRLLNSFYIFFICILIFVYNMR